MADQKKRSDLIRSQIENLLQNAPRPYTEAEKQQIMKGRKGQKDIDAGRAAIETRNEEIRQHNKQIEQFNEQLGKAETEERQGAQQDIEGASKKRYDEEASTGYGRATQLGANALAVPVGFTAGRVGGKGINALADISQTRKNERLKGVAQDRLSGLTTRKGALAAVERSGAMPSSNSVLRVGGRMLPHAIGGAGAIAKGGSMLANSFQGDDFYTDMTNRAMGLGLLASGVGVVQEGGRYAVNPGVPPDAQAMAISESEGLRRNNAPAAAAKPAGPNPGTVPALRAEAKAANIPGAYKMNKGQLQTVLEAAKKGLPKAGVLGPLAFPAAAGALAFGMTPSDAQASPDGSSVTGSDEALTNAVAAGGLTAAASRYAKPVVGALGRAAGPLTPFPAADLSDNMTPEDVNTCQNWLARNAPFTRPLPGSSIGQAYDMAQVPSRSPVNAGPRRGGAPSSFEQALAEFQALIAAQ